MFRVVLGDGSPQIQLEPAITRWVRGAVPTRAAPSDVPSLVRCGALRHPDPIHRTTLPYLRRMSGRFRALSPEEAEALGLFGGEYPGHLGGALALFAAHRDVRAAVRASPKLALLLAHGSRGAAVGVGEALLPRDPREAAVQSVREPSLPSHATSLSYPDTQTLPLASIHTSAWKRGSRKLATPKQRLSNRKDCSSGGYDGSPPPHT